MSDESIGSAVAAIDIGTNSIHLLIARPRGDGGYDVVERRRTVTRIGQGTTGMAELSAEAIERGIACLRVYADLSRQHDAAVHAVATSALRDARNADTFIARAAALGIAVEVISGQREAELIYAGMLSAMPDAAHQRVLLVDVGGGSTEVVVGHAGSIVFASSLQMGAIRLTDRWFPGGEVKATAVQDCRNDVRLLLEPVTPAIRTAGFDRAIVSSGTAATLAALSGTRVGFTTGELDRLTDELASHRSAEQRRTVVGLDPQRAEIIVAGAVILQELAHALDVDEFTYSKGALRDGLLQEAINHQRR